MAIAEKLHSTVGYPPRRSSATPLLPVAEHKSEDSVPGAALHPSLYVVTWISISSLVIIFNKWILDTLNFRYPVILTTYHLLLATLITQILARCTTALDGRKTVKMTPFVYCTAIVPIGVFYSASLICGNLAYLHLSVAFIQMLKATMPLAVLIAGWALGVSGTNWRQLPNVTIIVIGVVIASFGEMDFVLVGFVLQIGGVMFEALRLTMVQRLLNSADFRMDPLVSLYYFAPVCAALNGVVALIWEVPRVTMAEVQHVGVFVFLLNGLCAFMLNVSVVLLIGKTSAVVLTLCGVIKDILLVVASVLIWGTQVTALQMFGYGIALVGMIYYKLGYVQIKEHVNDAKQIWAKFGIGNPMIRRLAVICLCLFTALSLMAEVHTRHREPSVFHLSV